ncbi:MAG: NAD(P)-dependent oxidoreductase [Proteobacteria bacterium]|nr:NAD(P)-dependent oxidoreductase [Pseudomonadota bacterium]
MPPTASAPVVAVIAPGEMGHAVAARLGENGVSVLTSLAGRSPRSAERARKAGMVAVSDEALVGEAGLMLSIVPPAEAVPLAERFAASLRGKRPGFLYVDCNAIAPSTMRRVAASIEAAGGRALDAGIIGGPPKPGQAGPRFYASGSEDAARDFAALGQHGLDVRVIGTGIGQASALKMCYGALTKGLTALGTELLTAACLAGVDGALAAEMSASQKPLTEWLQRQIPAMPPKAYRWVAEMQEIALMFRELGLPGTTHAGAAQLYEMIAASPLAEAAAALKADDVSSMLAQHSARHKGKAAAD